MARFVSPPRDQLHKLRQPLTLGEWEVLKFFDAFVPPSWESWPDYRFIDAPESTV